MDTAVVVGVLAVCGALVTRHMARSLGVGLPGGKPDCGCGSCGEKRKEKMR